MATFLDPDSTEWALEHVTHDGDGDLFPAPFEFQILNRESGRVVEALARVDLDSHPWMAGRRMLIPKDAAHHRAATQLEVVDTLLMTAIIRQFGTKMERHRLSEDRVFSHRFAPQESGRMYSRTTGWQDFWTSTLAEASAEGAQFIVRADISDFYNQIYHHTLENQLTEAGVPSGIVKSIIRFAGTTTQKGSRGLPVGPHFVHLLAELALTPCDRALSAKGVQAFRYVDDFHILAKTKDDARIALQLLAETLDQQQRLALQATKTKILSITEFKDLADRLGDDFPRGDAEEAVLQLIEEKTDASPYENEFDLDSLTDDERALLEEDSLRPILESYLADDPIDYWRLAWILRRLAQTGTPGALRVVLENINALVPVIGAVGRYILHCKPSADVMSHDLGKLIANAVTSKYISKNKYIQTVLVNILGAQPDFNNIESLSAIYDQLTIEVRREVLLAAQAGRLVDWIREQKGQFDGDPWIRRALISACTVLPEDERKFWIQGVAGRLAGLDRLLAVSLFPGSIKLPDGFRF
jgi:hypothetical protein